MEIKEKLGNLSDETYKLISELRERVGQIYTHEEVTYMLREIEMEYEIKFAELKSFFINNPIKIPDLELKGLAKNISKPVGQWHKNYCDKEMARRTQEHSNRKSNNEGFDKF